MATGGETQESMSSPKLSFDYLMEITNDFSDERKLSGSPFGTLYKGIREDGTMIAVKKLHEHPQLPADKTFDKEVAHIMLLKHENIVELVGFCTEVRKKVEKTDNGYITKVGPESLLWYEYLPNGSLEDYLFGTKAAEGSSVANPNIGWDTRFKIVKGICQGILFLHKLDKPIIHMDLNNRSIWLGKNMVPKIGNFGLSRLFGHEVTKENTRTIVGSFGNMAPEYIHEGVISAQLDIYSLGLMILEISTREKNVPIENKLSGRVYIDKVRKGILDYLMVQTSIAIYDTISFRIINIILVPLIYVDS
ncbi:unnamed protein product [Alopecurus aequalis]